eukprot:Nk52_evm8s1916 gene=Nk52_evmTU8s1916
MDQYWAICNGSLPCRPGGRGAGGGGRQQARVQGDNSEVLGRAAGAYDEGMYAVRRDSCGSGGAGGYTARRSSHCSGGSVDSNRHSCGVPACHPLSHLPSVTSTSSDLPLPYNHPNTPQGFRSSSTPMSTSSASSADFWLRRGSAENLTPQYYQSVQNLCPPTSGVVGYGPSPTSFPLASVPWSSTPQLPPHQYVPAYPYEGVPFHVPRPRVETFRKSKSLSNLHSVGENFINETGKKRSRPPKPPKPKKNQSQKQAKPGKTSRSKNERHRKESPGKCGSGGGHVASTVSGGEVAGAAIPGADKGSVGDKGKADVACQKEKNAPPINGGGERKKISNDKGPNSKAVKASSNRKRKTPTNDASSSQIDTPYSIYLHETRYSHEAIVLMKELCDIPESGHMDGRAGKNAKVSDREKMTPEQWENNRLCHRKAMENEMKVGLVKCRKLFKVDGDREQWFVKSARVVVDVFSERIHIPSSNIKGLLLLIFLERALDGGIHSSCDITVIIALLLCHFDFMRDKFPLIFSFGRDYMAIGENIFCHLAPYALHMCENKEDGESGSSLLLMLLFGCGLCAKSCVDTQWEANEHNCREESEEDSCDIEYSDCDYARIDFTQTPLIEKAIMFPRESSMKNIRLLTTCSYEECEELFSQFLRKFPPYYKIVEQKDVCCVLYDVMACCSLPNKRLLFSLYDGGYRMKVSMALLLKLDPMRRGYRELIKSTWVEYLGAFTGKPEGEIRRRKFRALLTFYKMSFVAIRRVVKTRENFQEFLIWYRSLFYMLLQKKIIVGLDKEEVKRIEARHRTQAQHPKRKSWFMTWPVKVFEDEDFRQKSVGDFEGFDVSHYYWISCEEVEDRVRKLKLLYIKYDLELFDGDFKESYDVRPSASWLIPKKKSNTFGRGDDYEVVYDSDFGNLDANADSEISSWSDSDESLYIG